MTSSDIRGDPSGVLGRRLTMLEKESWELRHRRRISLQQGIANEGYVYNEEEEAIGDDEVPRDKEVTAVQRSGQVSSATSRWSGEWPRESVALEPEIAAESGSDSPAAAGQGAGDARWRGQVVVDGSIAAAPAVTPAPPLHGPERESWTNEKAAALLLEARQRRRPYWKHHHRRTSAADAERGPVLPSSSLSSSDCLMTSGSAAERTASSWSLPSKLNNCGSARRQAGTTRVHQNHLHHHHHHRTKGGGRHHNNHHGGSGGGATIDITGIGGGDTITADDAENDDLDAEARARRECFYRYRNLNPRTVAYLFARRNGFQREEDNNQLQQQQQQQDDVNMGRGEINSGHPHPYNHHPQQQPPLPPHRHHEGGGVAVGGGGGQYPLPPLPVPPPPYASTGNPGNYCRAPVPPPITPAISTTTTSTALHNYPTTVAPLHQHPRVHSAPNPSGVSGGDGIPPALPPRPPHLCHPRDIENSSGHRSRSRTRRATNPNNSVPHNNNNNSTTTVGEPPTSSSHSHTHNNNNNTSHHHNNSAHITTIPSSAHNTVLNPELLPDILNSHLPPPPPPYSTLPQSTERSSRRGPLVPPLPTVCPPPSPPHRSAFLNPNLSFIAGGARRTRASGRTAGGSHYTPDDEPKHCCGVVVTQTVSIRWFIIMIAFVGLCCAVVGTVLGALKTTGREHLTVSLLMIGVGIVLITVSGIAWRLTSTDAPTCRMMLGFHSDDPEPNRRFVPRVPPSYGRSHHPYAAMMYPDFQYRPPPPSYQASMQEYRLRLLLLDRQHTPTTTSMSPVSPPPTYRSHVSGRPPLSFARDSDCSRPPSYRSRSSSVMPRPPDPNASAPTEGETGATGSHSRDPSLSLSCLSHESLFDARPMDTIGGGHGTIDTGSVTSSPRHGTALADISVSIGTEDGPTIPPTTLPEIHDNNVSQKLLEEERRSHRKNRDSNAVTIVQTTDSSQVVNQDAVIVTVSGHHSGGGGGQPPLPSNLLHHEVEILAHL